MTSIRSTLGLPDGVSKPPDTWDYEEDVNLVLVRRPESHDGQHAEVEQCGHHTERNPTCEGCGNFQTQQTLTVPFKSGINISPCIAFLSVRYCDATQIEPTSDCDSSVWESRSLGIQERVYSLRSRCRGFSTLATCRATETGIVTGQPGNKLGTLIRFLINRLIGDN